MLSPNHYLFIFYSKFDCHPSKLVNINRQSSKLPPHWNTLFRGVLKGRFGRGVPPRRAFKPLPRLKTFILQPCLKKRDPIFSLCCRRLKGKGKGVLGARETRGAREGGASRSSRFSFLNSFSLPLQTPATQATLFYDPNSSFIFVYRIGIFFQKNIMELDVLE